LVKLLRLHCFVLEFLLVNLKDRNGSSFQYPAETDWWRRCPGSWRPRRR